jgi:2'-5' RNA ligase
MRSERCQSWSSITSDNSLFLLVQEGNSEIIRLHDELYTGVLAEFHRDDLPFVPHITLGSFGEEEHCRHALHEAEQLGFEYMSLLDRVHLVKVNAERSQIIWSKEFLL